MTITYARNLEDIVLKDCFSASNKGFYVDVDAGHPVFGSVTKLFYGLGWQGINLEADDQLYSLLAYDRSRDTNIHVADYGVISFKDIFRQHKVGHIQFLRIQATQKTRSLLITNDWKQYRPEVICLAEGPGLSEVNQFLKTQNYSMTLSDGSNQYFVDKDLSDVAQNFTRPRKHNLQETIIPFSLKQRLDIQEKEKSLQDLHMRHMHQQLIGAAKQIQWYERAPFSWMLRRSFASLDRALTTRLSPQCSIRISFAPQYAGAVSVTPSMKEIRNLSESYRQGISYEERGPAATTGFVLRVLFFGYRIVRKAAKLLFKLLKVIGKRSAQETGI